MPKNLVSLSSSSLILSPKLSILWYNLVTARSNVDLQFPAFQIKNPPRCPLVRKYMAEELAPRSHWSVSNVPDTRNRNQIETSEAEKKWVYPTPVLFRDEVLAVEEFEVLMQRLERVVEEVRIREMEKLMAKMGGELTSEEKQTVETMSREIVSEFLEKPTQYLRCKDRKMECKLKDLRALVRMLEESCLVKGKVTGR
uniref:Tetrapyrrole biosynthesis glutamyl-tRNA reductase dimerisation domain-containing protein n=1 Tax=Nelumbo nucifera TaxID=4432 RepID=A0A822YPP8_NELNU|nr:TPA_asm: hypothetical protein HUJ06_012422 [Nelumbo nucifera]